MVSTPLYIVMLAVIDDFRVSGGKKSLRIGQEVVEGIREGSNHVVMTVSSGLSITEIWSRRVDRGPTYPIFKVLSLAARLIYHSH